MFLAMEFLRKRIVAAHGLPYYREVTNFHRLQIFQGKYRRALYWMSTPCWLMDRGIDVQRSVDTRSNDQRACGKGT